jgi:hypothetical protein
MGTLGNFDHERFCQAAHAKIWAGEKRSTALPAAYRETIYQGDNPDDRSIAPNARRLVQRKDVKERLAELAYYSSQLAGIDASWALIELARRVRKFNLADYLTGEGTNRHFDISLCSRDDLAKLSELTIEEDILEAGEDTMRRVRKTRLKPYDPAAIIGLMAKIAGWEAPKKTELTGKDGVPLLEQLVSASYETPAKVDGGTNAKTD